MICECPFGVMVSGEMWGTLLGVGFTKLSHALGFMTTKPSLIKAKPNQHTATCKGWFLNTTPSSFFLGTNPSFCLYPMASTCTVVSAPVVSSHLRGLLQGLALHDERRALHCQGVCRTSRKTGRRGFVLTIWRGLGRKPAEDVGIFNQEASEM